jgi:hypothetical protein
MIPVLHFWRNGPRRHGHPVDQPESMRIKPFSIGIPAECVTLTTHSRWWAGRWLRCYPSHLPTASSRPRLGIKHMHAASAWPVESHAGVLSLWMCCPRRSQTLLTRHHRTRRGQKQPPLKSSPANVRQSTASGIIVSGIAIKGSQRMNELSCRDAGAGRSAQTQFPVAARDLFECVPRDAIEGSRELPLPASEELRSKPLYARPCHKSPRAFDWSVMRPE